VGAVAEAFHTLQLTNDAYSMDSGAGDIAIIQAQQGDSKVARQTASRIKHSGTAARSWLELARVQAQRKEEASATDSLGLAIRKGDEIKNPEWAIGFLQDIASLQAEIGSKKESQSTFQKALQILDRNDAIPHRHAYYRRLALDMGKAGFRELSVETFQKALKLSGVNDLGIKDKELQGIFQTAAISVTAEAQAKAGLITEAIQTAKRISDDFQRDLTIAEIGEQQALRGDLQGALDTAKLLRDKGRRDWIHYAVADIELDRGEWKAALKRGLNMEDSYKKALILRRAGRTQARNDFGSAMQWCRQLQSPEVRARALLGIAEGILDRR